MTALPYEVEVGRCRHPVRDCPDDMCRNSVERGLCGKYVEDDWDDYDSGDWSAWDDDWEDE